MICVAFLTIIPTALHDITLHYITSANTTDTYDRKVNGRNMNDTNMNDRISKLKLVTNPRACEENIIAGDKYRITIITPAVIRFEYSESGIFEDRATQVVLNRNNGKVDYKIDKREHGMLEIQTKNFKLYYDGGKFSESGLRVKILGTNIIYNAEWHYGEKAQGLLGTARTLDNINGSTNLDGGIIGRSGYAMLDDSKSLIITDDFVAPREHEEQDFYLFCHGHDYRAAIKDFYDIAGHTPLLPKYAMGNWWSRYYRYDQNQYIALMDAFNKEGIPFSVSVIDMDWHITDIDKKYGSGWTGFTWNKNLFPNHKQFLQCLHDMGKAVTLNIHPAEGIRGFEDGYDRIATHMGVDKANEEPVEFEASDDTFLGCYFDDILHPMEDEGVDFWWIDWQQSSSCKVPGLDPLWILNHYHYLDNNEHKRGLTFSRYAGPGSHRYPVGFSGDTHITWESLDFQPYFTANASNIGYGWWSHDIGGHMCGIKDNELELRWYQFGVFSPIMRLHSSCNEFAGKEPWNFPLEIHSIMNEFLRLRHKMVPYLYTMNYLSHKGRPLMSPMYYDYPEEWDAYMVNNQYYFGTEMIVAPITSPNIKGINMGKVKVWLPKGTYFDIFTDTIYSGDRLVDMYRDNTSIPVLAKAGAIIPLTDEIMGQNFLDNPGFLDIKVYPLADNVFEMYEDDGCTNEYQDGKNVITTFINKQSENKFIIKKPEGDISLLPRNRSFRITFCAIKENDVTVFEDGKPITAMKGYADEVNSYVVVIDNWDYMSDITIEFKEDIKLAKNHVKEAVFSILQKAEIDFNLKDNIYRPFNSGKSIAQCMGEIQGRDVPVDVMNALIEIMFAVS